MGSALLNRLQNLTLSDSEAGHLHNLALAAAANVQPSSLDADLKAGDMLKTLSQIVARDLPDKDSRIRFAIWETDFPVMGAPLRHQLMEEAEQARSHSDSLSKHVMAPGGQYASALHQSAELSELVSCSLSVQSQLEPTNAFIHYYDSHEHRAEFHVDNNEFTYNALVVLDHHYQRPPNSSFFIVPFSQRPRKIDLRPGGGIIFGSSALLHCRSAPAEGEGVITASFGFRERIRW